MRTTNKALLRDASDVVVSPDGTMARSRLTRDFTTAECAQVSRRGLSGRLRFLEKSLKGDPPSTDT